MSKTLYFIACNDYAIKIGFTEDIQKRIRQLQTANPYELKLLHMIKDISPQLEKFIHLFLNDHQIKYEWYEFQTAEIIIKHLKNGVTMLDIINHFNPLLYEAFIYQQKNRKLPWWYHKINEDFPEEDDFDIKKENSEEYAKRILGKWNKEHISAF